MNLCSKCKLDIGTPEEDGGCKCCKEHAYLPIKEVETTPNLDNIDKRNYGGYKYNKDYDNENN